MPNIAKPSNLNIIWASTGTKVDPGTSKTNIGWVVQLPPYEYQNWVDNRQDTAIAHINQHGIPEWDANTEYQGNLSYTQGSNGLIYKCTRTNIGLDPTNANNSLSWSRAFETFGSVQIVQDALTVHLNNYATLSGISNTVLARANLSVYSRVESDAAYAFKGGTASIPFQVGTATQPQHAVPLSQINSLLVPATESSPGTTVYATVGETAAGAIDNKAVTPLKAATIYLSKAGNLAGLGSVTAARANLGLGTMATRSAGEFLLVANNLADVNPAIARANLQLTSTATLPETYFLRTGNNLADVPSAAAARANLGLTSMATADPATFMYKVENLAGLTNVAVARSNLGLSDSVLYPSTTWLVRNSNLGDLSNVQAARNNLGLSGIVTKNVIGLSDPNGDIVFTRSEDATSGGRKMPDGTVFNWGTIQAGSATTYKIPFTSAGSYAVTVTHGPNALGLPGSGIGYKNATGFSLAYGIGGYQYIAIGY